MISSIIQVPFQLSRKMYHVTIGLTVARALQLVFLIGLTFFVYPLAQAREFLPVWVFVCIIGSVVLSGLAELAYGYFVGRRILPLKRRFDRKFTRNHMASHRKYGVAYYLSSFHMSIVVVMLSIFFPTLRDLTYVGLRSAAMSLIEILLVVPLSL